MEILGAIAIFLMDVTLPFSSRFNEGGVTNRRKRQYSSKESATYLGLKV